MIPARVSGREIVVPCINPVDVPITGIPIAMLFHVFANEKSVFIAGGCSVLLHYFRIRR